MPPWLRPPDGRTSAGRIVPVVGSLQPISNVQPLHVSSVPLRGAWKANDCIGHVTDDLRLPESCEIPLHLFIGQAAKILAILTAKEKGAVHHIIDFGQTPVRLQWDDLPFIIEDKADVFLGPGPDTELHISVCPL